MNHLSIGNKETVISGEELDGYLDQVISKLVTSDMKSVLLIPPDHTRLYSGAGEITRIFYRKLKDQVKVDIMPALGTHVPMDKEEIHLMFGNEIPLDRYLPHLWREDVKSVGEVPGEFVKEISEGKLDYSMKVEVNKILFEGGYDLILSIGQIVPHEVIGMANYTKNIMIGVGGGDSIHKSHFLGAVYGMERVMGHIDTPVRAVLNKGFHDYIGHLPIHFILTVMDKDEEGLKMRGLFCGDDDETYAEACRLSQQVNLDLLDEPIKKAVVYLDPREFKTTWLGNKAVYRLRMAMADDGELIILAPELKGFGEDPTIDELIRKYGYRGTEHTLRAVEENADLKGNLSAAAHLIHGSSEGRFKVKYCPGPDLSEEEIRSVGFDYEPYVEVTKKYDPETLKDGVNTIDGEDIFYVSNPALGLWALKSQFNN